MTTNNRRHGRMTRLTGAERRAIAALGGKARAAKFTSEERRAIALKAVQARQGIPIAYVSETRRMESRACGEVLFEDLGARLRLQIDEGLTWAIWNEAHVDEALGLLREWRTLRKAAARAEQKRRQGGRPMPLPEETKHAKS